MYFCCCLQITSGRKLGMHKNQQDATTVVHLPRSPPTWTSTVHQSPWHVKPKAFIFNHSGRSWLHQTTDSHLYNLASIAGLRCGMCLVRVLAKAAPRCAARSEGGGGGEGWPPREEHLRHHSGRHGAQEGTGWEAARPSPTAALS